jgi:hypothetical protein
MAEFMTHDDVINLIQEDLARVNDREAAAWKIVNDKTQIQWNHIRAQLVIDACISDRKNLLGLANSLGQLQQQYEASTRAQRPGLSL